MISRNIGRSCRYKPLYHLLYIHCKYSNILYRYENFSLLRNRFVMIILLLTTVLGNDVHLEKSIIPRKDSSIKNDIYGKRELTHYKQNAEAIARRLNLDKRDSNEKYDRATEIKTMFNNTNNKPIKIGSLAQKLANEALKSLQVQSSIKKLTDINGRHNYFATDQLKNVFKTTISSNKLKKLSSDTRKKRRFKHVIRRRKKHHLGLHKQNLNKNEVSSVYTYHKLFIRYRLTLHQSALFFLKVERNKENK